MSHLDQRLKTVARRIRSDVHVDVGSDHGHLLYALVSAGRIKRGIAIENKRQPFENSQGLLSGLDVEVRFADGLAGLQEDEACSLSICGMGGRSIAAILSAWPDRVPNRVVVQPNKESRNVRRWGRSAGFKLIDEVLTNGSRTFLVMEFVRCDAIEAASVYHGLNRLAAETFGPHLIRRRDPLLWKRLADEREYWSKKPRLNSESQQRLDAVNQLLEGS